MSSEKISRRKALKTAAAAAGGLGAGAFLPARWMKPVVESGVLPAHAQTSLAACTLEGPLFSPGINDDGSHMILGIHVEFAEAPKTGTPVKFIISNVVPAGNLTGEPLTGSGKTDGTDAIDIEANLVYANKTYSFDLRIVALGCFRDFHLDRS